MADVKQSTKAKLTETIEQFARDAKIFGREHRQDIGPFEQSPIPPALDGRKVVPAVEEPDALRDQTRPPSAS